MAIHPAPPPPAVEPDFSTIDPVVPRRPEGNHSHVFAVVIGITLFAVATGGVAAVGLHFFSEAQESQKKSDSKVAAKKTEPASANIIQKRKPEATQPKPVEEPPPVIPPTFQGEWDKAVQWSAKWDKSEPAATQEALLLLGLLGAELAKIQMQISQNVLLEQVYPELSKYGLFAFIDKMSRSYAMQKDSNYHDVVKVTVHGVK